jgi:cytochrome c5
LLFVPLAVVGAELVSPRSTRAQERPNARAPTERESARLFAKSCASCHVYPDASLPTDEAWLRQIMETS